MSYYIAKSTEYDFDKAIERIKCELTNQGFGILTEIDVQETLKKKLNIEFRNYRILGACNPPSAFKVLSSESHIGVLLPCNVIVQEREDGIVEVAAIDPLVTMTLVNNPAVTETATEISKRLKAAIDSL